MSRNFESAVIEHLDRGRRYGFVRTSDGKRVLFRFSRRASAEWHLKVDRETDLPGFIIGMSLSKNSQLDHKLAPGEEIYFVRRESPRGPEAHLWACIRNWPSQYVGQLAQINKQRCRVYVAVQRQHEGTPQEEVEYLFEGTIGELKMRYPAEQLVDRQESDVYFSYEFYLWQEGEEGEESQMIPIADPRPLP